ncbi:MAG: hypothetical protein QNL21_05150 [Flavobacteriales bacterium]
MNFTHVLCGLSLILINTTNLNAQGAHYDYEARCLGVELDGSATVECYGKGRNYWDAAEQAKKNAVNAILFTGIKQGNGGCSRDPIILSSSVRELQQDYFANFFSDDGPYKEFVSLKDERILNKVKRNSKKSKRMQQRQVVVRIDKMGLKKRLKEDEIID